MSSEVIGRSECLNCGTELHGEFCARCGQHAAHPNPTFRELLHEFSHELLHIDGRLWTSLWLLFTKPGFLTREYISGRRAAYQPPLRLYLICSIAYFTLAAFAPSDTTIQLEQRRGRVVRVGGVQVSGDTLLAGLSDEQIVERLHRAQHDWLPKFLFAIVPAWALLVMLVTWREHRNFPQHLYFALHVLGASFGLRVVAAILRFAHWRALDATWAGLTVAFMAWYVTVALRKVYGGSAAVALRRGVSLLAGYFLVVAITLVVFVLVAIRM